MGALGRVFGIFKGGAKFIVFWGGVMLLISAAMIGAGDLMAAVGDSSAPQPADRTEPATGGEHAAARDIEPAIHAGVNDARAREGVAELGYDDGLAAVARNHSKAMATQDFFAHESPSGDGPGDRLQAAGVQCQRHGENIAWRGERPSDADEFGDAVVEQWLDSERHRENLYRQRWQVEGIGVYVGPDRVYITQMFC